MAALLRVETDIVDYQEISAQLAVLITTKGGEIVLESKVDWIIEKVNLIHFRVWSWGIMYCSFKVRRLYF
jgi:L-2-hydroxyglutarate oxidase LhgO